MAAESHKELQKTGSFGDWARKDIQYSQFQNYELTYAHFVRYPSWEKWPPGLSPGVNWGLEPQCMMKCSQKSSSKTNNFFLMVITLFLLVCHFPLPPPPLSSNFKSNNPVQNILQNLQIFSKKAKKAIPNFIFPQQWIASLAISWLILAKFRQGIQNRLICSQWKSKISWWMITDYNLMKNYINIIIISIFPLSFHQYIGSSTQKTSCDRPLDSATPHPIKDKKKVNFNDLFKYTPLFNVWMFNSWWI